MIKQEAVAAPSYCHSFFFIAFFEEVFIKNVTIMLYIGCTVYVKNNYSVINNNCGRLKGLILLGHAKEFRPNLETICTRALIKFRQAWRRNSSLWLGRDWLWSDQGVIPSFTWKNRGKTRKKSESWQQAFRPDSNRASLDYKYRTLLLHSLARSHVSDISPSNQG